jgi:4-hydroxy-2-oxoheptanedioate aldolase
VGPFDERPYVAIQVETADALADIDAIANVTGVDALYIGPADLGLGLGGQAAADVNEVFDGTHPLADELGEAFRAVIASGLANHIVPGLHCGNGATARRAVAEGFAMTSVAVDLGLIGTGLGEQLGEARR